MIQERKGLCFRCEYRAQYFESGHAPRMECGLPDTCKWACFMYKPVLPVIIGRLNKRDPRPITLNILSARVTYLDTAKSEDMELVSVHGKTNKEPSMLVYWRPKMKAKISKSKIQGVKNATGRKTGKTGKAARK